MSGILARLMRGLREESGQAVVVGVVSMIAVLPCVGLAIDIGQFRYEQQMMQAAVDAAALAGAIEVGSCGGTANCAALKTAAQQALVENGFTGSTLKTQCASPGAGLTLTVNNGPCSLGSTISDPNFGNTSYVEAVLYGPANTFFANMVGIKTIHIIGESRSLCRPIVLPVHIYVEHHFFGSAGHPAQRREAERELRRHRRFRVKRRTGDQQRGDIQQHEIQCSRRLEPK